MREDMPLLVTKNMQDRHLLNMQECFLRSIIEEDNGELTFDVSLKDNDDELEEKRLSSSARESSVSHLYLRFVVQFTSTNLLRWNNQTAL